ncbi:MAG: leucyl aminopeptidase [Hyphomicrobiales bacterium]|nr:leucyl aminopeptidase [Rickettsiales bacterium]MCP5361788.1 leucyl aminopeptidase [Hyphomicrobiales bacterium]
MELRFAEVALNKETTVIFTVGKDLKLSPLAAELDKQSDGALARAIKGADFKGEKGKLLSVIPGASVKQERIVLLGVGEQKDLEKDTDIEALGGKVVTYLNRVRADKAALVLETGLGGVTAGRAAALIANGALLASYSFDKYFTKRKDEDKPTLENLTVRLDGHKDAKNEYEPLAAVSEGVFIARDLVSEPPNELNPETYAEFCKNLKKLGLKIEVLGEKEMQKLGMGALLGVGQGSASESQLVVLQWSGGSKSDTPIAFVGKGVTFDTGGISIKPAQGMEDMKYDMGGSAAVVGLLSALAKRKANVNAVGVIGLVENMPDGNAQRPSDIVKSMSGQTIEVLNTDAEGRLVLADALWYTQDRFKPKFMVNLATLTGAIVVALADQYAGLFSNDDELSERLSKAGEVSGERVWRFPLGKEYDKMIDSTIADMKNIGDGRGAGSITAAQFLQRFVNEVPWAHLDIAGMAWDKKGRDITPKGAVGFGVRLLNRLVHDYYEKH